MAFRVEVSGRAALDLDDIYFSIGARLSAHAAAWFNKLELTVQNLALFPRRGSAAREGGGLLQMPYGRKPNIYGIIYSADDRAALSASSASAMAHGMFGRRSPAQALCDHRIH